MKRCKFSGCRQPFEPKFRTTEICCSTDHAIQYARESGPDRLEKHRLLAVKAERMEARKAKLEYRKRTMSIGKLKNLADKEFGRFIRERDFGQGCICCGQVPSDEAIRILAVKGHLWDAGHYRSKGSADHLRYHEDNCHAQLVTCNRDKSGNAVVYRGKLIQKIGIARVEALENDNRVHKWQREELIDIRRAYLNKWKVLFAAREANGNAANCKVEGCDRSSTYLAERLCQKHYFRQWRYGTTDTVRVGHANPRIKTPNGYIRVYEPDHPAGSHNGYVFEHRKVAYESRGGIISVCERCRVVPITWDSCHVDHDDNNRENNAPSNLLVTCIGCNTMRATRAPRGVMLTFDGETKNLLQWSRDLRVKISARTIGYRKRLGASDEDALFGRKITHHNTSPQRQPKKFVDGKRVRA